MHRFFTGLRIALLALVCACAMFAQRDLATLAGTVTDSSGGVVANAKVTITETDTNESYSITTNSRTTRMSSMRTGGSRSMRLRARANQRATQRLTRKPAIRIRVATSSLGPKRTARSSSVPFA